jgi:hypothetical protein
VSGLLVDLTWICQGGRGSIRFNCTSHEDLRQGGETGGRHQAKVLGLGTGACRVKHLAQTEVHNQHRRGVGDKAGC